MPTSSNPIRVTDDGTQPITSTYVPAPAWNQPGSAAPKPISSPTPDPADGGGPAAQS
jgi:hypothetical protein